MSLAFSATSISFLEPLARYVLFSTRCKQKLEVWYRQPYELVAQLVSDEARSPADSGNYTQAACVKHGIKKTPFCAQIS